jgi:VCBS repeat-containing protein
MNARRDRLVCIVSVLALVLLIPAANTLPVQVDTGSAADLTAVTHECRLYAAISNDMPAGLLQAHLLTDPNSLKYLSASNNIDGWGLGYYSDYGAMPIISRGQLAAFTDAGYDAAVNQVEASQPKIAIGHVRACNSGCCCRGCYTIPDPHPFYKDKHGTRWTFAHNGNLDKSRLLSLIDPAYLAANPPNGSDIPACDPTNSALVVSSELYFTLVLQNIEENGWNVVSGIAKTIKAMIQAGEYGEANFVMSDGSTVWAMRRASSSSYTLHYLYGTGYKAVASQYTSSSLGNWQLMQDYELVVLTGDSPPQSIRDVREYPNLLTYPYLGETTPTSVVISWATDRPGAAEVRYSLDASYNRVVAATNSTYDGKYWHSAAITGLTPGATYRYKVYTSGYDVTPWSEITFTTATEPSASLLTFVVLGDSRPTSESAQPSQGARNVAAQIDQQSFELALHTGDMVYSGGICSGDNSSWNQYIRAYFDLYQQSTSHIPFYTGLGDHEPSGGSCGYTGYTNVYNLPRNAPPGDQEEYYSFDWGNAHFVVLDTNQAYSVGSTQYNWLESDLQASTQPWQFVYFHTPAYSSGAQGSTIAVQTELVPLLETYGVDAVFSGHDHHYERTCPILDGACVAPQDGGVVYYVTGGGGAPLSATSGDWFTAYRNSAYHFIKAQIDDCRLRLEAINADDDVFDSYEIDHCPSGRPTAVKDSYATNEDTPLTVSAPGVLDNDSDVGGAPLTAVLVRGPAHGALTLNSDGGFAYTPGANWVGADRFTYRANNGVQDSNMATVSIAVQPVNDPPQAVNDSYTIDEDIQLSISAPGVLSNDDDIDSATLEAVRASGPAHGTLTLNRNGSFTYRPYANWSGTDSFTYVANDGALNSDVATVSIVVRSVNDPPQAANDSYAIDEDIQLSISAPGVLSNDSDIDSATLEAVRTSGPAHGTLTLNRNGSFTYRPYTNWNGTDSFAYVANDGASNSNTATVSILVRPISDPPNAVDDSVTTREDTPLPIAVLANDSDPDGDALTISGAAQPAHGTVIQARSVVTYSPSLHWTGTDSFTYTASDGTGRVDTATVRVTVLHGMPTTVTILLNPSALTANSNATAAITATVVDAANHPLQGVKLSGKVSPPALGNVTGLGATDATGRAFGLWSVGRLAGIGSLGIGDGTITGTTAITLNNPIPVITSLSPVTITWASAPFTLTVNGVDFVDGSGVYWNGAARATTFVSATQLQAAIPRQDVWRMGTMNITVSNPPPGGGMSEGAPFTVTAIKAYMPSIFWNPVLSLAPAVESVTAPDAPGNQQGHDPP